MDRQLRILVGLLAASACVAALFALGDWAYGYYVFVRWLVFLSCATIVWSLIRQSHAPWALPFIVIGIIFNPLAPVMTEQDNGRWLDGLAAIALAGYCVADSKASLSILWARRRRPRFLEWSAMAIVAIALTVVILRNPLLDVVDSWQRRPTGASSPIPATAAPAGAGAPLPADLQAQMDSANQIEDEDLRLRSKIRILREAKNREQGNTNR